MSHKLSGIYPYAMICMSCKRPPSESFAKPNPSRLGAAYHKLAMMYLGSATFYATPLSQGAAKQGKQGSTPEAKQPRITRQDDEDWIKDS